MAVYHGERPAPSPTTGHLPAVPGLVLCARPAVEVIVVDDASTDGTGKAVTDLGRGDVRVIRTPSGGKAGALDTGIAFARNVLIVMVDADTVVVPDSVHRLLQPFADPHVGAVSGNVKVGDRRGLLGRRQHIEYVIGFNLDRRLYDALGCIDGDRGDRPPAGPAEAAPHRRGGRTRTTRIGARHGARAR
jgi:cellulose synthase/poly-beta-1,6-N-acetylglucosamine synthase-like glycosyltransferase